MESRRKCERELGKWIDSLVDEMNGIYCADLTEAAKVDAKMSDIKVREELIGQITEIIRCKKISERIMAEQAKNVVYNMNVRISAEGITYGITRSEASS
jgi:hypothetical protein